MDNPLLTGGFVDVPKSYLRSMCYFSHCVSFSSPSSLSHALVLKRPASGPQPGSDLERHAASDCAHLQAESASQRGPSVVEELGWPGV